MIATTPTVSRAVEALRHSSHPALRRLAVEESESTIVILGRVSTYYLKQLAQETVMPERGQRQLINQVTVGRE